MGVLIAIISHKRQLSVHQTKHLLQGAWPVIWVVGRGEGKAYRAQGAANVVEGGGLCQSRNLAIEIAKNKQCRYVVEISDDLKSIRHLREGALTVEQASAALIKAMHATGLKFAGAYPVVNHGWAEKCKPFSFHNFVVGDFIVVDTTSPIRFDERLGVKEDYDFTMAHIKLHGGSVRANHLLVKAAHRKNEGGACSSNREVKERHAISLLKHKWGAAIRDNPRRPLEVVIHIPKVQKSPLAIEKLSRLAVHPWHHSA
jgi:hypothetical protein